MAPTFPVGLIIRSFYFEQSGAAMETSMKVRALNKVLLWSFTITMFIILELLLARRDPLTADRLVAT